MPGERLRILGETPEERTTREQRGWSRMRDFADHYIAQAPPEDAQTRTQRHKFWEVMARGLSTGTAYAIKKPAMLGGMTALGGGFLAGDLVYLLGKGAKLALGPATHSAIHYDKKFGEGFDNGWKMTREFMGIKTSK